MPAENENAGKSARQAKSQNKKSVSQKYETAKLRNFKTKEGISSQKIEKVVRHVGRISFLAAERPIVKRKRDKSVYVIPSDLPSGKTIFLSYYIAEPLARINMIRHGILAKEAKQILSDFTITQANLMRALKISPATINRKAQGENRLLPAESERVLGMARLVGQIQAIVEESGNPEGFDATAWMSRWLSEPLPALNGTPPLDLLDTMEGQSLVSNILARVQSGAYT